LRIGLVSAAPPLARGGGRRIMTALLQGLRQRGHAVEPVLLPMDESSDDLLQQVMAYRLLDLDPQFERVITLRPPAHVVRHRCKIVLLGHRTRAALPDGAQARSMRATLDRVDAVALGEAHAVLVGSTAAAERLRGQAGVACQLLGPGRDAVLAKLLA
jgi:hypothetical protein